ncbi:MAG: DNA-3-methyladenine glycosylase I [Desulfopila sp.]|jgi:DNA-3-methyladenine glycosylase I|nr:DNA-3-methyladenine glycosylase I [Desulfopila sp.]
MDKNRRRCGWCSPDSELYIQYHDAEWGVPLTGDRPLFEMLILEGMQAGLSWLTVLRKRASFKEAFDDFDPAAVAAYDDDKIEELLQNPAIIRNRLKIEAARKNGRAVLLLQQEYGSFTEYLWRFVNFQPICNTFAAMGELPAKTDLSTTISKDMKKRGMNFVGPTIVYAFMQAIGMVNDHETSCFRHAECVKLGEEFARDHT